MYKGRIARFDAPGTPFEIETVSLPERRRPVRSWSRSPAPTSAARTCTPGTAPSPPAAWAVSCPPCSGTRWSARRGAGRRRLRDSNGEAAGGRHPRGVPVLLLLPHLPQLPGGPTQCVPEPEDGDAGPRRRAALLRRRLRRLLPATGRCGGLHRARRRLRRHRCRRQLRTVASDVRARTRRPATR